MSFTVRVLTPEKIELETTCDEVILPAVNGNLSILTGHARLVSVLKTGVFRQKKPKKVGHQLFYLVDLQKYTMIY
jgi:F0F1-type ATP synthase epsilon subunit